jgi:transcriptional regulator with XRE-family HTH domain
LAFEYQAETLRFHIARLLEEFRLKSELTQIQMADKIGVSQSFIARLENPEANKLPTLETLSRVAHGLGKRLVIQFVDIPQVGPAVIDTLK